MTGRSVSPDDVVRDAEVLLEQCAWPCGACGAPRGEECRPSCAGSAVWIARAKAQGVRITRRGLWLLAAIIVAVLCVLPGDPPLPN